MSAGAAPSPRPDPDTGSPALGGTPAGRTGGGLDRSLQQAIAAGLLPPDAQSPVAEGRPWPVVLLTALGAWLAAVPLLGVVAILLGDLLTRGPGPYLVGVLVLAAAVAVSYTHLTLPTTILV